MNDLPSLDNNDLAEREAIIAKWKDKPQDELLKAKAESDLFVKTLTTRLDDLKKDYLELREQHQTSAQLKDLIDRLEKERGNTNNSDTNSHDTNRDNVQPSIKPEDIQALVNQEIAKNKSLEKQTQNFSIVEAKLKEVLGENYHASYKQRRENLGLSEDFANDLARNHPSVFIKTFELDNKPESFQSPPRSAARPTSFAPSTQKRDWNYYQAMKKDNPRLYLDPKIAVQMHEDMMALGPDFGLPQD